MFLDASHLIDEALEARVDAICKEIPGFNYGRLDIMFESLDGFRQGRDYAVIEVNGSGSEPTHMYDPRHSLLFAWKEIIRHWIIQWRIARSHHREGVPYMSWKEGWALIRRSNAYERSFETVTND